MHLDRPSLPWMYAVEAQAVEGDERTRRVYQNILNLANANGRLTLDDDTVAHIAAFEMLHLSTTRKIIDDLERRGALRSLGATRPTGRWSA
jgi:hypothetical protein